MKRPAPLYLWSAAPTPFTAAGKLDRNAVCRMIEHHAAWGIQGVMLGGTCGEGAWLRDSDRELLAQSAVSAARGRLTLAMQVTDNSVGRVLDNIERAAAWGVDIAVLGSPYLAINVTPQGAWQHFNEVVRRSTLPIGLYDRGTAGGLTLGDDECRRLLRNRKIVLVKDSSRSSHRRAAYLAARRQRSDLTLLSGDEFHCVGALRAGYDGLLLGGAVFNGRLAARILAAACQSNWSEAARIQRRMNGLMWRVYGGRRLTCWLAGLKELLTLMGLFSSSVNLLGYRLSGQDRARIRAIWNGTDGNTFDCDLKLGRGGAPRSSGGGYA